MFEKTLTETVKEMKGLAEILVPYTFPRVDFRTEQEILVLKQRTQTVDGYEVTMCYSKADYGDYTLQSLQLQSAAATFLPFVLVCKLGKVFLGETNLSYIEFIKNNKKIYCWTTKSQGDRLLPADQRSHPGNFEGFQFNILCPGAVDLY